MAITQKKGLTIMKLKLNNGTEINILNVNGTSRFFQNANRDCLEIQIAKSEKTLDEIATLFVENNTKSISLLNDDGEFIHENYSLRAELSLKPIIIAPETPTSQAVIEERICVTMAQKQYAEIKLQEQENKIAMLEEAVAEMAYGGAM